MLNCEDFLYEIFTNCFLLMEGNKMSDIGHNGYFELQYDTGNF